MGYLVAESVVFVAEFADSLVGEGKSLPQRCIAGAFAGGRGVAGFGFAQGTDPADFVFEVGLGLEPGA